MKVWVVGWAQDLDDWGIYSAHATEQQATEAAEAVRTERHFDAWNYRGRGASDIRAYHEGHNWDCCLPQVVEVVVDVGHVGGLAH